MAKSKVTETVLVKGRLISANAWEANDDPEHENHGQWTALLVLDKDQAKKVKQASEKVIKGNFDEDDDPTDWVLRKGTDKKYENTMGKLFINAKNKNQEPHLSAVIGGQVINLRSNPEKYKSDYIYAGSEVGLSIDIYPVFKRKGVPASVTCGLRAIRHLKDGERIGGFNAANDFDDNDEFFVEDESDADDFGFDGDDDEFGFDD